VPRKISTITLHDNPAAAAAAINSVSDFKNQLTGNVQTKYILRGVGYLRFDLISGSDFMMGAAAGTHFTINDTIKITYDDATASYWRVYKVDIEHAGGRPTRVECLPYWTMLDRRAVRVTRSPNVFVDVTLALTGLTVAEALAVIAGSTYNAPPYFQAGTVDSAFSSSVVNVEANGESHLDLLWKLMDDLAVDNSGAPAEFEIEWNSGDSKFDINVKPQIGLTASEESGGADATLRPIDSPTGGAVASKGNRIKLNQSTGSKDFFNRIVPFSNTEEEPVTIGQCEWGVSSASLNTPSAGQTTINLRGEAIVNDIDLDASGTVYFGNEDVGFFEILSFTDADTFVIDGLQSTWTLPGRFTSNSSGTELVYLELAGASSDNAIAERSVAFDIPPFANWINYPDRVASSGLHSADLSDWTGGLPDGWSAISASTITEVTDAQYVRHGTSSAKVQANTDDGIEVDVSIQPTQRSPYYSMYVNMYVESGRVRLTLEDGNGTVWPTGEEQAESNSKELRAISVGGMEPLNSSGSIGDGFTVTLKITALVDGTIFYVDSASVTRTTYPIPYRGVMGLNELWRAAARFLSENGGVKSEYSGEFYDRDHYGTGSYEEALIGSHVRIRDAFDGSSFDLSVDARIVELEEKEDVVLGRLQKKVKVSTVRDTASSRLIGRAGPAALPSAPPAKTDPAASSSGGIVSQSYFIGSHTAAETVSGVDIPLRAAAAATAISGAYLICENAVATDPTNYVTIKVRNATQDVDIAEIDTSAAGFTALTAHSLTANGNRLTIAAEDVLYVEITGAGTGAAIDNMVVVLEAGGVGGYTPAGATHVYFANETKYKKAPIGSGTGWPITTIKSSITSGRYIDSVRVDELAGYIFGKEYSTTDGDIRYLVRYDLDGTNQSDIVSYTTFPGYKLAAFVPDTKNQKLYCMEVLSNTNGYRVVRRDYSGTLEATLFTDADHVSGAAGHGIGISDDCTYIFWRSKSGSNDNFYRHTISDGSESDIHDITQGPAVGYDNDHDEYVADSSETNGYICNVGNVLFTMPYAGGGSQNTISGVSTQANKIALDPSRSRFFTIASLDKEDIQHSGYDGSNDTIVIQDTEEIVSLHLGF